MTFQLQIWRGKVYEPQFDNEDAFSLSDAANRIGAKAWRIVDTRKDRPLKPKYTRSRRVSIPTTTKYTAATVVGAYFAWAKAKGLSHITVYENDHRTLGIVQGFNVRTVAVADFLGDAPAPEEDEQS